MFLVCRLCILSNINASSVILKNVCFFESTICIALKILSQFEQTNIPPALDTSQDVYNFRFDLQVTFEGRYVTKI